MLKNMKIAYKLVSGFIVLLLMMASVAAITLFISSSVKGKAQLAQEESVVFAGIARNMKLDVVQVQQYLSDISATRGLDGLNDGLQKADEARKSFLANLGKFREMYRRENDAKHLKQLDEMEHKLQTYYEQGKVMAQAYIDGGPASGNKHMAGFDKAAEELTGTLDPFVEEQVAELNASMVSIVASANNLSTTTLVATLLSLSFGLLGAWLITRSITRPLNAAVTAMRVLSFSPIVSSAARILPTSSSVSRTLASYSATTRGREASLKVRPTSGSTWASDASMPMDCEPWPGNTNAAFKDSTRDG